MGSVSNILKNIILVFGTLLVNEQFITKVFAKIELLGMEVSVHRNNVNYHHKYNKKGRIGTLCQD